MDDKMLEELMITLEQCGWIVAIPKEDENGMIHGLIIGSEDYVDMTTYKLELADSVKLH